MNSDQFGMLDMQAWSDDLLKQLTKLADKMKERENVNRDEVIQSRIRELEAELAQRRRYGIDGYANGTVLSWEKTFSSSDGVFRYAAVKADERWYVTGAASGGKNAITWDRLITNYWTTDNVVDEVLVGATWKVIGQDDETVQTAPLASWIAPRIDEEATEK